MELPFANEAVVPEAKLTHYLLSPVHPEGRSKAAFFSRLGFEQARPEPLRQALLQLARTSDMTEIVFTFGRKYVGTGTLTSPNGTRVAVVTVWVLRGNLPPPMLVTAYPA